MSQELPEGAVTVLFTDVVGSAALTTSRGDEATHERLRDRETVIAEGAPAPRKLDLSL
jgi:class 3 adenylate cyclase